MSRPETKPYNRHVPDITISGTGCSLADLLYTNIDFDGERFGKYRSRSPGDGGLVPGKLVFAEEIERFSGLGIHEILAEITGDAPPASRNLGGPAVVALINASQLLFDRDEIAIRFTAAAGDDDNGAFIRRTIAESTLDTGRYKVVPGDSPVTYVLSDPHHNNGQGERTFINDVAAAWKLTPEDLDEDFYSGDILLFGATGLVPRLHDALTELLRRGKELERKTIVTTVYDFRAEKRDPHGRWPLGASDESYRLIDLLITDREEALRLSGRSSTEEAGEFFSRRGVGAYVITSGPDPVRFYSSGALFTACSGSLPVSEEVGRRLTGFTGQGDTTGCGDNFAGGLIASLALQLAGSPSGPADLASACALGIASGGFACFYLGGTFHEGSRGEKRRQIEPIYETYRRQVDASAAVIPFDRLFRNGGHP